MKRLLCIFLLCIAAAFGGTTTFSITQTSDIYNFWGKTDTNATGGASSCGMYNAGCVLGWQRVYGYNEYQSAILLLRYHTSGLGPVTSASIQWPATWTWIGTKTGCNLKANYYTGAFDSTSWPTNSADGNDALGPIAVSTSYPAAGSTTALSTLTSINRSGDTVIRVYIDCGDPYGQPYMDNYDPFQRYVQFGSLGVTYPTYLPQLIVTTNNPPTTNSVSGIPGNFHYGTWQTISAQVGDPDGYGNLSYWHLLINYGVDGGRACYFMFYPNSNTFYLLDDAGGSWGGGCTMGAGCTLSNNQCKVDAANSSFSNSGTTSTANMRIMFLPGALSRNPMNAYLYAVDASSVIVGWNGPYQTGYVRTRPKLIVRN